MQEQRTNDNGLIPVTRKTSRITVDRASYKASRHMSLEDIQEICKKMRIPVPDPIVYTSGSDSGENTDTDPDNGSRSGSESESDTDDAPYNNSVPSVQSVPDASDSDDDNSDPDTRSEDYKRGPCGDNGCVIL